MAPQNMYSMETLIKRLEAVASRLEDIGVFQAGILESTGFLTVPKPPDVHNPPHNANAATAAETPNAVPGPSTAPDEPLERPIEEFDHFLRTTVHRYVALSRELGDDVGEQAARVRDGFQEQRRILALSTQAPKPDGAGFRALLRPMEECAEQAVRIKERGGDSAGKRYSNHLSAVADGVGVLGWICVEMRPFRHVDLYLECAQYFGDRVIKEYHEKDPKQVEWIRSFYQVFRDLSALLKEHYSNGIPWNHRGARRIDEMV